MRHACARTHPAVHLLSLLLESESRRWEEPATVRLDHRPASPTHPWHDVGCCGYLGEEGAVETSDAADAGPGFRVQRFRLRSRCAHVDLLSVVATQPAVIFGAVVTESPPTSQSLTIARTAVSKRQD